LNITVIFPVQLNILFSVLPFNHAAFSHYLAGCRIVVKTETPPIIKFQIALKTTMKPPEMPSGKGIKEKL